MGVPAFFRWLSGKYPSVIVYCVEEKKKEVDGYTIPVDSSQPNPNGVEFDNLYLDMNGIIHPCTHPEDKPAPKDEDEMMVAIFECIDRLFSIVRPRKLLYMAIDGVAPRAKMNQQRSRRFRASKESTEKIEEVARLRSELLAKGAFLPPEKPKESHFDSNCITPGTPFMDRLSKCLHYYIHERLNNDPGWKGIKVILSDANVPGEGEHKIMDFIRRQRAQPDHDPNTQHCLCGADADLIMLGLATHEPNFTIIREEFRQNKPKPCDICHQLGHDMKDCIGSATPVDGPTEAPVFGDEIPFIFVRLNVLREYLERDLQMPNLPFKYEFERVIDDWVFMCFFVGNDFLPHLPSLEIREGAIDRLVQLYKSCVYKTGGFVTDSGEVNMGRVQIILSELGKVEDEIFKKRQQTELMYRQRNKQRKRMALQNKDGKPTMILGGQYAPNALGGGGPSVIQNPRQEAYKGRLQNLNQNSSFEAMIRPENSSSGAGTSNSSTPATSPNYPRGTKRPSENDSDDEDANDEVRLWEEGFKDRYYESKFDVDKENLEFRVRVAHEYAKGLCWVLRYYYQGCASWKWFFPYHYAPFASDFIDISGLDTTFEKGTQPFRPLEQLMSVFPAASSSHVPKPWATLMHDPNSPIIDFYPIDFKIDLNGKKFAWQGVALLPFVEEKRLFKALQPYYDQLTPAERKRNIRGDDRIYLGIGNSGYNFLKGLYENPGPADQEVDFCVDGMRGKVLLSNECIDLKGILRSPVRNLPAVEDNMVLCARFRDPKYGPDFIFKAKRLEGVIEPQRVLKPGDLTFEQNRNWRPQLGMAPRTQRATLDSSGHRALDHYNNSFQRHNQSLGQYSNSVGGGGAYSRVPPPERVPLMPQFSYTQSAQSYGYHTAQGLAAQGGRDNSGGGGRWNNSDQQRYNRPGNDYNAYNSSAGYRTSYNDHNNGYNRGDRSDRDGGGRRGYETRDYRSYDSGRSYGSRDERSDNRINDGRNFNRDYNRDYRGGGGGGGNGRRDDRYNSNNRGYAGRKYN